MESNRCNLFVLYCVLVSMKTYSIQMTSLLSGVSADCIRAWERRYGAIVPERDKGRRIFDDEDITRLLMLKELSFLGNPISSVAKLTDQELTNLCQELGLSLALKSLHEPIQSKDSKSCLEYILVALETKRADILLHELNKASDDFNSRDFSIGVMSHLIEIFFNSSLSEIQKKSMVGIFKSVMMRKIGQNKRTDLTAVVGFVPGEKNELKALMAALVLSHHGYHVTYIEPSSEVEVVIEAAKLTGAKIIFYETDIQSNRFSYYCERFRNNSWKGQLIMGVPSGQDSLAEDNGLKISMVHGLVPLDGKLKNL
jgi:DNA-binding transcriptional MerR regulator